ASGLREHCRTCDDCRAAWERGRILADAIASWRDEFPEVDLVEAVVTAHLQPEAELPVAAVLPLVDRAVPVGLVNGAFSEGRPTAVAARRSGWRTLFAAAA